MQNPVSGLQVREIPTKKLPKPEHLRIWTWVLDSCEDDQMPAQPTLQGSSYHLVLSACFTHSWGVRPHTSVVALISFRRAMSRAVTVAVCQIPDLRSPLTVPDVDQQAVGSESHQPSSSAPRSTTLGPQTCHGPCDRGKNNVPQPVPALAWPGLARLAGAKDARLGTCRL